jgi:hypothetical protein
MKILIEITDEKILEGLRLNAFNSKVSRKAYIEQVCEYASLSKSEQKIPVIEKVFTKNIICDKEHCTHCNNDKGISGKEYYIGKNKVVFDVTEDGSSYVTDDFKLNEKVIITKI